MYIFTCSSVCVATRWDCRAVSERKLSEQMRQGTSLVCELMCWSRLNLRLKGASQMGQLKLWLPGKGRGGSSSSFVSGSSSSDCWLCTTTSSGEHSVCWCSSNSDCLWKSSSQFVQLKVRFLRFTSLTGVVFSVIIVFSFVGDGEFEELEGNGDR